MNATVAEVLNHHLRELIMQVENKVKDEGPLTQFEKDELVQQFLNRVSETIK